MHSSSAATVPERFDIRSITPVADEQHRIMNARAQDWPTITLASGDADVTNYPGISTARPVICPAFSLA